MLAVVTLDWTALAGIAAVALVMFFPKLGSILVPILRSMLKVLDPQSVAAAGKSDAVVTSAFATLAAECPCDESRSALVAAYSKIVKARSAQPSK